MGLPPLPHVTVQVMRLIDDPRSSTRDFERVITQDAALASKVLRMANSAYYGGNGRISTVSRAIAVLGMNTIRTIVMSLTFHAMVHARQRRSRFNRQEYWRHSLATAIASRVLARLKRSKWDEEAFLAGLLHDIGRLIADQFLAEEMDVFISHSTEITSSTVEEILTLESKVLGATHVELGDFAAQKWNLPAAIRAGIAYHHQPLRADKEYFEPVALVHAANCLVNQAEIGVLIPGIQHEMEPSVKEFLGIPEEQYEPIRLVVAKEVIEAQTAFGVN
ncbi:MAG: HDOD domain-containing protein [Armatimonadota bacterium]|nr:HDOD domain-containing protein [bacterium]MDW8321211.1 HDOD domain-containing protein [Armatimonadota bacterium]